MKSVTCDLEVRERQNICTNFSKKICESTGSFDGFVTISSLAGVIPPSVTNIEVESNVTTFKDEDEKRKAGRISIS